MLRVEAYMLLMVDEYPPFSFEMSSAENPSLRPNNLVHGHPV